MDSFTHKCPNCGGPLLFDPKDQKFHCEYCLNVYTEEEVTAYEKAQREAHLEEKTDLYSPDSTQESELSADSTADAKATESANTHQQQTASDNMELFICSSCGAEIVTDATTAATYCYYCHNPVLLSGRVSGNFLPDKVLPFSIEKEEAVEQFLKWTKKKWFIPKDFFNKQQIEKLTGVYFPYWSVDSEVNGEMDASGTTIRIWRVGEIEFTETKQFAVGRKGKMSFRELLKNALSKNTQQKMMEGVQPFPIDQAVDFKSQYLAGFQAEKRDIEYEAIKEQVARELKDYSESLLKDSAVGYTTLTNIRTAITVDGQKTNYVLLPMWLVTYRNQSGGDQVYYYAMNGRTGKVNGVLPISYKRLGLFSLGLFAVLLILFLIGGYMI